MKTRGLTHRTVTPKTLAANRSNGRKSAGPVTAAGSVQSRRNPVRHWGRAEALRPLMPALGEGPGEFDPFRQDLSARSARATISSACWWTTRRRFTGVRANFKIIRTNPASC